MEKSELMISKDLQKFIDKFEPNKFKVITRERRIHNPKVETCEPNKFKPMTRGIQIRGINDLHRNITEANYLIERLKLNLVVTHNAEMLSYRGFEVNNRLENE